MILAPSDRMSDQGLRAIALAKRAGTGVVVTSPSPDADELARALRERVTAARPAHDVRLDGVETAIDYATE